MTEGEYDAEALQGLPSSVTSIEDLEELLLWFIDWAELHDDKLSVAAFKDGYRYLREDYQGKSADHRPEVPLLGLEVNTAADLYKVFGHVADRVEEYDELPSSEEIVKEAQEFVLVEMMSHEPDAEEIQQIVINTDHGGFGLSDTALQTLHEDYGWEIRENAKIEEWTTGSKELRLCRSYDRDLRAHPDLIEVVEQLGEDAAASTELKIVEIPANVEWTIDEYDGKEWVAEAHRTWS